MLKNFKLRKQKADCIQQSVNAKFGLAWTDGHSVFLSQLADGLELSNSIPKRLGDFDEVTSVLWNSSKNEKLCYLCVVSKNVISLWCASGDSFIDISLTKIRQIEATPISQGCVWNEKYDILCVLTKTNTHLYWNNETTQDTDTLDGAFTSCCWSNDGKKLLLARKASLTEINFHSENFKDYKVTTWVIQEISGTVLNLRALIDDLFVCTVDPTIQQICQKRDLFFTPELTKMSEVGVTNHKEDLLSLAPEQVTSSEIILLQIPENGAWPVVEDRKSVEGILGIDLFLIVPNSHMFIVGSGTSNSLLLHLVENRRLVNLAQLKLEEGIRPRGVCGTSVDNTFLVAYVNNSDISTDVTFPSLSLHEIRDVFIASFNTDDFEQYQKGPCTRNAKGSAFWGNPSLEPSLNLLSFDSTLNFVDSNKMEQTGRNIRLITSSSLSDDNGDLEIERVSFDDSKPNFTNKLESYFGENSEQEIDWPSKHEATTHHVKSNSSELDASSNKGTMASPTCKTADGNVNFHPPKTSYKLTTLMDCASSKSTGNVPYKDLHTDRDMDIERRTVIRKFQDSSASGDAKQDLKLTNNQNMSQERSINKQNEIKPVKSIFKPSHQQHVCPDSYSTNNSRSSFDNTASHECLHHTKSLSSPLTSACEWHNNQRSCCEHHVTRNHPVQYVVNAECLRPQDRNVACCHEKNKELRDIQVRLHRVEKHLGHLGSHMGPARTGTREDPCLCSHRNVAGSFSASQTPQYCSSADDRLRHLEDLVVQQAATIKELEASIRRFEALPNLLEKQEEELQLLRQLAFRPSK